MLPTNSLLAIFWWGGYTIFAIWAQKIVPGVDFLAPGLILSMQEKGGHRTLALAVVWMLLQEGMGNLPFGYGVAWYGMLAMFYVVGRWLFEARSFLFMCMIGVGLGALHPILAYSLAELANMVVPVKAAAVEGVIQAAAFPVVWLFIDYFFPRSLRQDVRPL